MAVRSKRLATGSTSTAGANNTIVTAPPGETVLIKTIVLYTQVAGPASHSLRIKPSGQAARTIGYWSGQVDGQRLALTEWWVLNPGDALELSSNVANACVFHVFGAELEGAPD